MPNRAAALLRVAASLAAITALAAAAPTADGGNDAIDLPVARASSPIKVDGRLDEAAWAGAAAIPVAFEWAPGDNVPALVETTCLVTYDDRNLYVGFRAADPDPSAIRAHYADRDSAMADDTVGFILDTFDDRRRGFQFRVNPLGMQMDAINSDPDSSEDWDWDTIWESVGRVDDHGYTVEIAIPFSSLRFPRSNAAQTWGFLAMRDYPRSLRHRLRSEPIDRSQDCVVCQLGRLHGFAGVSPGRNLELDPTLTAVRTDRRADFPRGPLEVEAEDLDLGLSGRWGITPNVAVDFAGNPDFSQVEADADQLEINSRFALFFPEKRPFFLEGADLFATPIAAVFTRTVADPSLGLKLTGKEGKSAAGIFVARDSINNLVFPTNQSSDLDSIDQDVTTSVLRYRRDVGAGSNLGALYAGRHGDGYANHVYGIDGTIRPARTETIRFQYLRSETDYPDSVAVAHDQEADRFRGDALDLQYRHSTRNWFWNAQYRDQSRGFRADSGFEPRVDIRGGSGGVERTIWGGDGDWFTRLYLFAGADWTHDHDGLMTDRGQDLRIAFEGARQTEVSYTFSPNRERFAGEAYDNLRQSASFSIRPTGDLALALSGRWGGTLDVANERDADFITFEPSVEWSVGRRLQLELEHSFQRLSAADDRLFTANLSQARMVYHINPRTFVRGIFQYRNIDRNVANYFDPPTPKTEQLFSQLLFSYKLNARTVALIGYSDTVRGDDRISLTRSDRTFFVKFGYAWVM